MSVAIVILNMYTVVNVEQFPFSRKFILLWIEG